MPPDSPHSWPESAPALSFFSSERPTIGTDRPAILRPDGTPFSTILPTLMITPQPDGSFDLWGFFPMDGTASSPKFGRYSCWDDLSAAYARWLACPEKFAVEELGWWPREATRTVVRDFKAKPLRETVEISLDDLM